MYRQVCMACHDSDGKGKIVKLAMPTIPDLTDPKFQASRTDAELTHSILEGKESTVNGVKLPLMLSMKDKLALGHTDVKDMVAFMRAFKGGKQVVSATPGAATPVRGAPIQIAQATAPTTPAAAVPITSTTPAPTAQPSAPANSSTESSPPATSSAANRPAGLPPQPPAAASTTAPTLAAVTTMPPLAQSAPAASTGAGLPPALPASTASSMAQAERIRAAGTTFNTLCIACHGVDGRGTAVRAAMPLLPNFTAHDWHTTKSNSQLATTILEGKGLMPAWNAQLSRDKARDLALYIRSFGAPEMLAETQGESSPSTVAFDNEMQSLRQQFDAIEKQLQALATNGPKP